MGSTRALDEGFPSGFPDTVNDRYLLPTAVPALVLAALSGAALANGPPSAPPDLAYRVGPGDVLEVTVEGRPDLSRLATVQTTGTLHYPLVGDVPVAELTVSDVAARIGALLAKAEIPGAVSVRVREYNSRSVFVVGEVRRPGRQALKSSGRLMDALIEAGGFSPTASGDVLVERRDGTFGDGTTTKRFRFQSSGPTPEDRENLSLLLQPGDQITARPRVYVVVSGQVERPGRYPLEDSMTVTKALDAAGGITRLGHPKVALERAHAAEGEPRRIEVDTRAVRAGESPDPTLRPDDALLVRVRKL